MNRTPRVLAFVSAVILVSAAASAFAADDRRAKDGPAESRIRRVLSGPHLQPGRPDNGRRARPRLVPLPVLPSTVRPSRGTLDRLGFPARRVRPEGSSAANCPRSGTRGAAAAAGPSRPTARSSPISARRGLRLLRTEPHRPCRLLRWGACDGGNIYMSTAYLTRWAGPVAEADDPYDPLSAIARIDAPARPKARPGHDLPPDARLRPGQRSAEVLRRGRLGRLCLHDVGQQRIQRHPFQLLQQRRDHGARRRRPRRLHRGLGRRLSRLEFQRRAPRERRLHRQEQLGSELGGGGLLLCLLLRHAVRPEGRQRRDHGRGYRRTTAASFSTTRSAGATTWDMDRDSRRRGRPTCSRPRRKRPSPPRASTRSRPIVPTRSASIRARRAPTRGPERSGPRRPGPATSRAIRPFPFPPRSRSLAGQKFSVVVKFTTPGYNYPVATEMRLTGYSDGAVAHTGESLLSSNGSTWTDLMREARPMRPI